MAPVHVKNIPGNGLENGNVRIDPLLFGQNGYAAQGDLGVAGAIAGIVAGAIAGGQEHAIETAPEGTACRKGRPVPGSHLRGLGCGEVGGRVVAGMLPEILWSFTCAKRAVMGNGSLPHHLPRARRVSGEWVAGILADILAGCIAGGVAVVGWLARAEFSRGSCG